MIAVAIDDPETARRRVHAIVTGRVQGVAFRASTASEAGRLGLVGWVRNLPDDSVELEAEGNAEAVAALVRWLHRGPPSARVTAVAIDELAVGAGSHGFEIRR